MALRSSWSRDDFFTTRECPTGYDDVVPEETRRDGNLVDGDGLEVYEAAVGACGAGEAVGVAPGCDIGVEEVVSSAEGSKWLKMS